MRKGTALVAVLFVITLGSAASVGAIYVVRQMVATSRYSAAADVVQPAAEGSLTAAIVAWDSVGREDQPFRQTVLLPVTAEGTAETSVWVTRLAGSLYWLVAESSTGTPTRISRRIGVIVHVNAGHPVVVPERGWSDLP